MPFRVERFVDPFDQQAIRAILVRLPSFVLDRIALDLELFLRNSIEKKTHAIGLEP